MEGEKKEKGVTRKSWDRYQISNLAKGKDRRCIHRITMIDFTHVPKTAGKGEKGDRRSTSRTLLKEEKGGGEKKGTKSVLELLLGRPG